jgi:Transcriptional regulators
MQGEHIGTRKRSSEVQPGEELRYLILAAQREGGRLLTEALRPLHLTPAQAEVLSVLQDHQPLSLIALGSLLICESGSPSRLVNGLVAAGFIKRIPSTTNGRMVTLTLTAQGEAMAVRVRAAEAKLDTYITDHLTGLSTVECRTLLWRLVEELPAGEALARRSERIHEKG